MTQVFTAVLEAQWACFVHPFSAVVLLRIKKKKLTTQSEKEDYSDVPKHTLKLIEGIPETKEKSKQEKKQLFLIMMSISKMVCN